MSACTCRAAPRSGGWQPRWVPRLRPSAACQVGHAALLLWLFGGCSSYSSRPLSLAPLATWSHASDNHHFGVWHAGLGDIMLTCYGSLSRNRSVGVRLGQGEKLPDILASSSQVAEGVATAGACGSVCPMRAGCHVPVLAGAPIVHPQRTPPSKCCSGCGQLGSQVPGPAPGADGGGAGERVCIHCGVGKEDSS